MNVERLQILRDHIAALPPEKFNMARLFGYVEGESVIQHPMVARGMANGVLVNECGTVACLAGWTLALFQPEGNTYESSGITAGELLGLDWDEQADPLFMPDGYLWEPYTTAMAVQTLDHLKETGEVLWPSFES